MRITRRAGLLAAGLSAVLLAGSITPASATTTQPRPSQPQVAGGSSSRVQTIHRPRGSGSWDRPAGKAAEVHTVTLRAIGRDGRPDILRWRAVPRAGGAAVGGIFEAGSGTVEVPAGDYAVEAVVGSVEPGSENDLSLLVQPSMTVDDDLNWTADARVAKGIEMILAGDHPRSAEVFKAVAGYELVTDAFEIAAFISADSFDKLYSAQLGPSVPGDKVIGSVASAWGEPGRNRPYVYAAVDHRPGQVLTGHQSTVHTSSMAEIHSTIHAPTAGSTASWSQQFVLPGSIAAVPLSWEVEPPVRTRLYVSAENVVLQQMVAGFGDPAGEPTLQLWDPAARTYQPGRRYVQRWGSAALGPRLPPETISGWWHEGDTFVATMWMYSDAAGHWGVARTATSTTRLYRDGQLVAESRLPGHLDAPNQPAGRARYRLEATAQRARGARWSTDQSAAWEFTSSPPTAGREILPLWTVSFEPVVDSHNVSRNGKAILPLRLQPAPGADVGTMRTPRVEVSFDRGRSWRRVPVVPGFGGEHRWLAVVAPAPKGGTVSVRARATDSDGNHVEQTIIDAYGLGR